MKKALILIVFGTIMLCAVAAIFAPSFISTEAIKNKLIVSISDATGRRLSIDGPLKISAFPTVGIEAEKVSLSNPPGFEDVTPFLSLKKLRVNVGLVALLSRNIEVNSFILEEPVVNLHTSKNGAKNWDFAKNEPGKKDEKKAPAPAKLPPEAFALPDNMRLKDVEIRGGTVHYVNDMTGAEQMLSKLDADFALSSITSPFQMKGSAEWNGKPIKASVNIDSLYTMLNLQHTKYNVSLTNDLLDVNTQGYHEMGAYVGNVAVKSSSLKALAAWLSPKAKPLNTPAALAFNATSNVRCGINYCNFASTILNLDAITGKGDFKVNTGGNKPELDIQFQTAELDLTPFAASAAKHAGLLPALVADADAASERWSREPIDLSALKQFNARLAITTDTLKFNQFKIDKPAIKGEVAQGKANFSIADAGLYEGKGSLRLQADSNLIPAAYAAQANFDAIQLMPLLSDLGTSERISGTATLNADVKSQGGNQSDIISALAGSGKLAVTKGQISGINLLDMLHNVGAAFSNTNSAQSTSFSDMNGSFTINQGIVTNPDLAVTMSGFNVKGQGSLNLPDYTIQYRLAPQNVRTVQEQGGATVQKEGLSVPVIIEGSLDHPAFRPDVGAVVQDVLSDPKKFREELKNTRGSLKDQLKDPKEAVKNIKNLFKGR